MLSWCCQSFAAKTNSLVYIVKMSGSTEDISQVGIRDSSGKTRPIALEDHRGELEKSPAPPRASE